MVGTVLISSDLTDECIYMHILLYSVYAYPLVWCICMHNVIGPVRYTPVLSSHLRESGTHLIWDSTQWEIG